MRVLLINPWIYDFAAFDMWAFPLGLLSIAAELRRDGWDVSFIDCVSRFHPSVRDIRPKDKPYHTGKYPAAEIPKPEFLSSVMRRFQRFGIPEEAFRNDLENAGRPDAVMITSRMTYWYPGVKRCIEIIRDVYPETPVILGGVYAGLQPDHALKTCRPDIVFIGEGEKDIIPLLENPKALRGAGEIVRAKNIPQNLDALPFPAWDLQYNTGSAAVETSRGCPYQCTYCASSLLVPGFRKKSPERAAEEIEFAAKELGAEDFAFYDDALLFQPEKHFLPLIDIVLKKNLNIRFHTPNSIFASKISEQVAEKMKEAGFRTIRLSLETTNPERLKEMNRKITPSHFVEAMKNLRKAGFTHKDIGAYLMTGLPGQKPEEVKQAIDFVIDQGATPRLAEYSPIPVTPEWDKAVENADFDLEGEPLFQNNTVFHLFSGFFPDDVMRELKDYNREKAGELNGPG